MATKSILKDIEINTRGKIKDFAKAITAAENAPKKDVVLQKPCHTARPEDIRKIFGEG